MDFKIITKHIPNSLTCANLVCGCIGIYFAAHDSVIFASWCIVFSCLFDFLDGFAARLFKSYSLMGKELDSLADMVSFGVLPAYILFSIFSSQILENKEFLQFLFLIMPICAALRLAKFNIDTRQAQHFIGLPTPAVALFVISIGFSVFKQNNFFSHIYQNPYFLLVISLVLSALMVLNINLFSLKLNSLKFKEIWHLLLILFIGILLFFIFGSGGLPILLPFYLLLSKIVFKNFKE